MIRRIRWHFAKRRLAAPKITAPPRHVKLKHAINHSKVKEFPPDTESYVRLASYWDDYAGWFVPAYGPFVVAAGSYFRRPTDAVLDLACGTGLLTRQVAARAKTVVGLDASEAMLREARRQPRPNVRFVRGDFRAFSLDEMFDAAICGSDSLNYVQTPAELGEVFRCVGRHLRPGGFFAFDVLDEKAFQRLCYAKAVVDVAGESFTICHYYDPQRKVSEARGVFRDAVERHRRIPIEEEDVRLGADGAGLEVAAHFCSAASFLVRNSYARQFYVLRRP